MRTGRPSPRIARSVPVAKRLPDPKRSASHLAFVRSLPCTACRGLPAQAHHENYDLPDNAMGMKAHDRTTVPLCVGCHARRHQIGAVAFWRDTDIAKSLMDALWRISGDIDAGQTAVFKAWQNIKMRSSTAVD